MSRPSRGFTVAETRRTVIPSCPSTGTCVIATPAIDDWIITFTWTPSVTVGHIRFFVAVNGDPAVQYDDTINATSPTTSEVDPFSFGGDGDVLTFHAECSGIAGCPDFVTASASATISV